MAATRSARAGDDYLVLLTEPRPLSTDKPVETLVAEYSRWAGQFASEGRLLGAGRLDDRRVYQGQSRSVPVGSVSGYFIIRAASLEELADSVARSPHRSYGGEVEIRPIVRPKR